MHSRAFSGAQKTSTLAPSMFVAAQKRNTIVLLAMWSVLLPPICGAQSALDQILQRAKTARSAPASRGLTNDKIIAGLKEALTVSTRNAVAFTGRPDGFLKNEAIKILVPDKLRNVSRGLRLVGMGSEVDSLEVGMNRAAEQATPAAKQIFIEAVKQMTFRDARQIFSGSDSAATDYFKGHSSDRLIEAFSPIVHQAMENVGVVRQYNQLMKNPMAARVASTQHFNLDEYVVEKTVDGLFYVMAQEEAKIRKDPTAQTTTLLKEVFGSTR